MRREAGTPGAECVVQQSSGSCIYKMTVTVRLDCGRCFAAKLQVWIKVEFSLILYVCKQTGRKKNFMGKSYWELNENVCFLILIKKKNLSKHQGNDYALDRWWRLKAKSPVFYFNKSTSYIGNDSSVCIFVYPSSSLCKTVRIRNCSKMVHLRN